MVVVFGSSAASASVDVCDVSLSSASIVMFLTLKVLRCGSLAVWFGLSDPRVAFVRKSKVLESPASVVLIKAMIRVFV